MDDVQLLVQQAQKRQKTTAARTLDTIDGAIRQLRSARDGGTISGAPVRIFGIDPVREDHKVYYASLSKLGKAIDKELDVEGFDGLCPYDMWGEARTETGLQSAIADHLARSGNIAAGAALCARTGAHVPYVQLLSDASAKSPLLLGTQSSSFFSERLPSPSTIPLSDLLRPIYADADDIRRGYVAAALTAVCKQQVGDDECSAQPALLAAFGRGGIGGASKDFSPSELALQLHLAHISELLQGRMWPITPQNTDQTAGPATVSQRTATLDTAHVAREPVHLTRSDTAAAALAYARMALRPFAVEAVDETACSDSAGGTGMELVGRAVKEALEILTYPRVATDAAKLQGASAASKQADGATPALAVRGIGGGLFSADVRHATADAYVAYRCSRLGVSTLSPLQRVTHAAQLAMPSLMRYLRLMRATGGGTAFTAGLEVPVDVSLPPHLYVHSVFCDPVARQQCDPAPGANPPMLLLCGHVVSQETLTRLSHGRPRFKCPVCPSVQTSAGVLTLLLE